MLDGAAFLPLNNGIYMLVPLHNPWMPQPATIAHLHMQVLEPQLVLGLHGQLCHLLLQLCYVRTALLKLGLADQHLLRPWQLLLQDTHHKGDFSAAELERSDPPAANRISQHTAHFGHACIMHSAPGVHGWPYT